MKNIGCLIIALTILWGCGEKKNAPDISAIQAKTSVERFDIDFFSVDTLELSDQLSLLHQKYAAFLPMYLENILGVSGPDEIKSFYRLYRPVFDSAQLVFRDFKSVQQQLENAFRYVKYYFPTYTTPTNIIPVIGRIDSRNDLARMDNGEYTPIFLGPDMIGISLQFYIGKNYSLYKDEYFVNNVAPLYRSRRFSKEYIVADVMKLITDDLYPDKSNTQTLINQMIEKGKRWWLLDKFLPETPDSVKTGYTQAQLDWCKEYEGLNWSFIIKDESLHSLDPGTIQTYIGESPFTNVFSQEYSPGNIGPWFGLQIVKKFEKENPGMKLDELMKTTPQQILEGAKYKPK